MHQHWTTGKDELHLNSELNIPNKIAQNFFTLQLFFPFTVVHFAECCSTKFFDRIFIGNAFELISKMKFPMWLKFFSVWPNRKWHANCTYAHFIPSSSELKANHYIWTHNVFFIEVAQVETKFHFWAIAIHSNRTN